MDDCFRRQKIEVSEAQLAANTMTWPGRMVASSRGLVGGKMGKLGAKLSVERLLDEDAVRIA